MSAPSRLRAACCGLSLLACSSGNVLVGVDHGVDGSAGTSGIAGSVGVAGDVGAAGTAGTGGTAAGAPSATELLAALGACNEVSSGELAPEAGRTADVKVCGLSTAVYWQSEFAVDCDGKKTTTCNSNTDKQFTASTVGKDSSGNSLDAAVVPYIEVPVANAVFDYAKQNVAMGSVAAVIYKDRLAYGVVGHEQDAGTIGSGSYAMAVLLGIDPDPESGGLQGESVTYIAFTGTANQVSALEDVAQATMLGKAAAAALVASSH